MAFTVNETTSGNDSGSALSDDGKITYSAKRSFQISSDVLGLSSEAVRFQLQQIGELPWEGTAHPDNAILRCRSPKVTRVSPIFFTATVDYASVPIPASDSQDPPTSPFDIPATVDYRSVTSTAQVDEDINGDPIRNEGTEEPITGIERRVTDVLAIVKRNFLVFSGPTIRTFMDKTNTDNYLGFPPGEGMIQNISASETIQDDVPYFEVSAEILFRTPYQVSSADAWKHRRFLKGTKVVKNGKNIKALDSLGAVETQPVFIDEAGERLDAGATPIQKLTQLYGSIAFSGMGFFS